MSRRIDKITPDKVKEVKAINNGRLSIRQIATAVGISYYTVWHILKGTYDTQEKLSNVFAKPIDLIRHF